VVENWYSNRFST